MNAATRDNDRPFAAPDPLGRRREFVGIGAKPADSVHVRFEEGQRVFIADPLHVLRQSEKGRTAIGRIEHGRNRRWQRLDQLRRVGDAVPVARDGLEGIVDRNRRVVEMLDLLQNRIRQAVVKHVTRQE